MRGGPWGRKGKIARLFAACKRKERKIRASTEIVDAENRWGGGKKQWRHHFLWREGEGKGGVCSTGGGERGLGKKEVRWGEGGEEKARSHSFPLKGGGTVIVEEEKKVLLSNIKESTSKERGRGNLNLPSRKRKEQSGGKE